MTVSLTRTARRQAAIAYICRPGPRDSDKVAAATLRALALQQDVNGAPNLCDDCPPAGYPTNKTRCLPCPRRIAISSHMRAEK